MRSRAVLGAGWLAAMALVAPAAPVAEQAPPPAPIEATVPEVPPPPPPAEPLPEPGAVPPATPEGPAEAVPAPEEPPRAPAAATPPAEESPTARGTEPRPRAIATASGSVSITDFSFGPSSITVGVGDSVTWRNDGPSAHTATAADGSFDTGLLERGESGSATFQTAGSFSYLCTPHPFMKGTVDVVAQADGAPPAGGAGDSTGSTPAAGATDATSLSDGTAGLPATGGDALWLAITGVGLLAIGSVGRGRSRPRNT